MRFQRLDRRAKGAPANDLLVCIEEVVKGSDEDVPAFGPPPLCLVHLRKIGSRGAALDRRAETKRLRPTDRYRTVGRGLTLCRDGRRHL